MSIKIDGVPQSYPNDGAEAIRLKKALLKKADVIIHNHGWHGTPESFLAAIVESSDDAIIGKTLDGTVVFWNKTAEKMYGYSAKEAVGRPISIIAPPDKKDETLGILEKIKTGQFIAGIKTTRIKKDGTKFPVYLKVSPIFDAKNRILGASTIARDITGEVKKIKEIEYNRRKATLKATELKTLLEIQKLTEDLDCPVEEILAGIAESIPDLWMDPEFIGVRIHLGDYESSYNLPTGKYIVQRSTIKRRERKIGYLEIYYGEGFGRFGGFDLKSTKLIDNLSGTIERYIDRRTMVEELRTIHTQLVREQLALLKKNKAMKEILEQIDKEKRLLKRRFQSNIDNIVSPLMRNLRIRLHGEAVPIIDVLESSLQDINSEFIGELESKYKQLTPRELEVCNLIKKGLSTKEIAPLLGISSQTVSKQRALIRKKLDLVNRPVNIASYLKSFAGIPADNG